jgi:hypothetical protein
LGTKDVHGEKSKFRSYGKKGRNHEISTVFGWYNAIGNEK